MIDPTALSLSKRHTIALPARPAWGRELRFLRGADLAASFREVSRVVEELDLFLASVKLEPVAASNLLLVLDELASNAARHIAPKQEVQVRIELFTSPNGLRFHYCDDGQEFNPLAQAEPYVGGDLEMRQVGGLGLFLVRKLFPDAKYSRREEWNSTEIRCPIAE